MAPQTCVNGHDIEPSDGFCGMCGVATPGTGANLPKPLAHESNPEVQTLDPTLDSDSDASVDRRPDAVSQDRGLVALVALIAGVLLVLGLFAVIQSRSSGEDVQNTQVGNLDASASTPQQQCARVVSRLFDAAFAAPNFSEYLIFEVGREDPLTLFLNGLWVDFSSRRLQAGQDDATLYVVGKMWSECQDSAIYGSPYLQRRIG